MVFNPFKKKDDFVDLTAEFEKQKQRAAEAKEQQKAEDADLKKSFYPNLSSNNTPSQIAPKSEESETTAPFGIFNPAPTPESTTNNEQRTTTNETESSFVGTSQDNASEKRKKLAKRLMDMTTKIEDLSNQVYQMQQRIEVLERKTGAV